MPSLTRSIFLVELDGHGVGNLTGDGDVGHVALALERGHDRAVDIIAQLGEVHRVAGDAQVHGRHHVHAHLHIGGHAGGVRELACHGVAGSRDLDERRVHVGVVRKLEEDHRAVLQRNGAHVLDAAHARQLTLEDVGDVAFNLLRARTDVRRHDSQVRDRELRKEVGLHVRQRNAAKQQADDDGDEDEVWFFDRQTRKHSGPLHMKNGS